MKRKSSVCAPIRGGGKKKTVNVLIAGVGGQGVLLASELLAEAAFKGGCDVKKSEVHGMAQRGGSVVSHLRFGEKINAPLIPEGEADYIVSFEKLEALRYLPYLSPRGAVLVNDQEIPPLPVSTGRASYPEKVEKILKDSGVPFKMIDALALAKEAGNAKAVNSVILGLLSKLMPFERSIWEEVYRERIPDRFLEVNLKAFSLGRRRRVHFGQAGRGRG